MLFVLVIDALNTLMQYAVSVGVLRRLTSRRIASSISLFVDDVVLFCHPDEDELTSVKAIPHTFGAASGLHTNYAKCSVTPIQCSDEATSAMGATLEGNMP